ncbi:MAG: hypothetical protein K1Y36_08310 [Blastocatellia bacterium]|nr:hypothetical protein [Blastocatellia bacterium]
MLRVLTICSLLLVLYLSSFLSSRSPNPLVTTAHAQTDVDISALVLEVTQGVQDLNNSVRLVANKRTIVRFYVATDDGTARTTAVLQITGPNGSVLVNPINADGEITVVANPNRGVLSQSFVFEIPDGYRTGTISLRAIVNPVIEGVRPEPSPRETNYDNNSISLSNLRFENVPTFNLIMYNVGYRDDNGTVRYARDVDFQLMAQWLLKAWPISGLRYTVRRDFIGDGLPDAGDVNEWLRSKRVWDLQNGQTFGVNTRYYGMVSDLGGFMRGRADGLPGIASSGPTGVPRNNTGLLGNWDTDGSYGDWYGAHEVAHTMGRFHAEFCGAAGGRAFPNASGSISPTTSGASTIYGLDLVTFQVYGPDWTDNMAYCSKQWVSRFTYHGIMDAIQNNLLPSVQSPEQFMLQAKQNPQDRLLIFGQINPKTKAAEFDPFFVLPNALDVEPRTEGDYRIVLKDAGGAELASYKFTPNVVEDEGNATLDSIPDDSEEVLEVSELVPFVAGTVEVNIVGPDGTVFQTVKAGSAIPTVKITSPNGGEDLSGETVKVEWTAEDVDGDNLFFNVQYSPDGGKTWEMVDQNVKGNSSEIDTENLPGGKNGMFRVWVTDGINTANDTVDAPFNVPNRMPELTITAPANAVTVVQGSTVTFSATAYDTDEGSLEGASLKWSSDLDGPLGEGNTISIMNLRAGTHKITLTADDGDGGVTSTSIQLNVKAMGGPPKDTVPPVVSLSSPNGGDALKSGKVFTIRWTSTDNTGVLTHDINLSVDGGATFPTVIATGLSGAAQSFDFTPTSAMATKKGRIQVTAKDAAGNVGRDQSEGNFKIK